MNAAMLLHMIALVPAIAGQVPDARDPLVSELQVILDMATLLSGGTGLSLGVALPNRTISLSSGKRAKANGLLGIMKINTSDAFAMGSTTKMYTAAAILRLVDEGKVGLDQKALPLFNELWTTLNGLSITDLMGPQIENVTVRQLLQMRSGVPDFDNAASRGYQFDHPDEDLGPVEELNFLQHGNTSSFTCDPGTCGLYSSSNYEILGLILAQQAGVKSWDEYNQSSAIPEDVLADMPNTAFAVHGPCRKYTQVHGYSAERHPAVDVYNISCTNGWACGNLMSTGADAAVFVRALLGKGERMLKTTTQTEMMKTLPLDMLDIPGVKTTGWMKGLEYGLGLMDMSQFVWQPKGSFFGHGGETYGFFAETGYSVEHDFGLSLVANSENIDVVGMAFPLIYKAVVQSLNQMDVHTIIV